MHGYVCARSALVPHRVATMLDDGSADGSATLDIALLYLCDGGGERGSRRRPWCGIAATDVWKVGREADVVNEGRTNESYRKADQGVSS